MECALRLGRQFSTVQYAELKPIVDKIAEYEIEKKDIFNLNELLKDSDQEITKMAEKELVEKKNSLKFLEQELLKLLIPKDINDSKNSILEKLTSKK